MPRNIRRTLQRGKRDGRVVRIEQSANLRTAGMQAISQFDLRHARFLKQGHDYFLDGARLHFARDSSGSPAPILGMPS